MPHSVTLIHTIAAALGLALALGFVATRLRLPALIGYLLAGVVIGPYTPGFVADAAMASQLAEIGVMLLMFGVGLHFSWGDLLAVRKIAVPGAVVQLVGRRLCPWVLWQVARTGSRELFTLCVVAAAVGIAFGSAALFGVSFALGAFFAGMVMRESEFSHRAAQESLPLRDAFAVLFFVSVGMLFDPSVLWSRPMQVLAVVAIIMLGKTLAAAALVLAFRYPLNTALTVSA